MEILDNGSKNPILIVPPDEVLAWLRSKADEAGYADRATCAVQITVENPFGGDMITHPECPTLILMVSNIKDSRGNR